MGRIILSLIFIFLLSKSANSQRGLDLTRYVYESDYIVCGQIISADTLNFLGTDPYKAKSVIVKIKVLSKLKGLFIRDTINVQYYPVKSDHFESPELQVDSLYFGFMNYNSQLGYYEPYMYDYLCFSSIKPYQIPYCVSIVKGLLDDKLDSCSFFQILMKGVEADILLINRTLDDIYSYKEDLQSSYCIDQSTINFLYNSFRRTHNTRLINFIGDQYIEEIDSILLFLITSRLKSIDESLDLYDLDDKVPVYNYIKQISYIKQSKEMESKLNKLQELMIAGTHSEFTSLVREMMSAKRR